MPSLKSITKKTGIWKWLALGAGLTAGIVVFAYDSHKKFEETIVNNFNSQQAVFISSLQIIVLNHIDEVRQNLEHIVDEIQKSGSISIKPEMLTAVYLTHLDDFLAIGLFDEQGRLLFAAPQITEQDTAITMSVRRTIRIYKDKTSPFISEKYSDSQGRIVTDIFVPFLLDEKKYFVVGNLRIEEYMKIHFSLWAGGDICFIMADDDGDILSLLNVYHEDSEMMKRGNLFSLDDACLSCHEQDEFSDALQARQKGTVHTVYKYPDGRTTNKTSISFPVHNKRWTMSICSPFEHIQGAIDENASANLLYSLLSLLVVGSFGYATYRTRKKGAILEAEADLLRIILETTESLRESEKKYRTLFDDSRDAIVIVTWEGKFADVNQSALDLFGYTKKKEMTGQEVLMMYANPDDRPMFLQKIEQKGFVRDYVTKYRKKDGAEIDCLLTATAWRAKDGKILGTQGIIRDITEQKKTEEALQQSEEKFRTLFDNATDGILIADPETKKFITGNPAICQMSGYALEEVERLAVYDIHPEKDLPYVKDQFERLLKGEFRLAEDIPIKRKDGSVFYVDINSFPITLDGTLYLAGILRDITERKKAEEERRKLAEQLVRAQKMESLGLLAGGMAHDLNNILSGLVTVPQLVEMQIDMMLGTLEEESSLRKQLSELKKPVASIRESGQRAADVVQDLLTLARSGIAIMEIFNLNDIVKKQLSSPEFDRLKALNPNIQFRTNLKSDLLNIRGSEIHLLKSLMNLVTNAAEAMPQGGKVTITTRNRYIDKPIKGYDTVKEGDYAVLTVADTGTGISYEDLQRIFEPFYTNKEMGRSGTGLGMSVVWGTMKDHNGYIDVDSIEGKGTTFTLYFPATREEVDKEKAVISIEGLKGHGETILVVDDVEQQREIASQILTTLGYDVKVASSGEEAIKYLRKNSADLLLLDMLMEPGIDGLDTYEGILEIHPKQKAIIASGYAETDRVKEAQRLSAGAYVKKPYTLEKLGMVVREELDKK